MARPESFTLDGDLRGLALLRRWQAIVDGLTTQLAGTGTLPAELRNPGLIFYDDAAEQTKQVSADTTFDIPLWSKDAGPLALIPRTVSMVAVSHAVTIAKTDSGYLEADMDTATQNGVVTLPAAADVRGRLYVVRKSGDSDLWVEVTPASGEEIVAGYAADEPLMLQLEHDNVVLWSNGGSWDVLSRRRGEHRQVAYQPSGSLPNVQDGDAGAGGFDLPPYVDTVYLDATGGDLLLNLPSIEQTTQRAGCRPLQLKRLDSSGNTCTVDPTVSDAVDGGSAGASFTMAALEGRTLQPFQLDAIGGPTRWLTTGRYT